jgi:hypothetical protein
MCQHTTHAHTDTSDIEYRLGILEQPELGPEATPDVRCQCAGSSSLRVGCSSDAP